MTQGAVFVTDKSYYTYITHWEVCHWTIVWIWKMSQTCKNCHIYIMRILKLNSTIFYESVFIWNKLGCTLDNANILHKNTYRHIPPWRPALSMFIRSFQWCFEITSHDLCTRSLPIHVIQCSEHTVSWDTSAILTP